MRRWWSQLRPSPQAAIAPARVVERPSDEWVNAHSRTAATYVLTSPDAVAVAQARWPQLAAAIITCANRALAHEFDLLGSGPFCPADPDRTVRGSYVPIDWYLDPVRGLRFPRGVPHKQWNLYAMRPGNADVKYPWELARCQHWVTLGQAYALTGDERYAREIVNQLDDFREANPVGVGINWTCTMDVGLRAVNWVVALDLIRRSAAADDAFWSRAYSELFDHGVFIRNNLENTYEVTSNHFLSNVVGLWFLAAMFRDVPEGEAWREFAQNALEQEMGVQVLPDGADFESSVPYHRLVAELFLGSLRLGDVCGWHLSDAYRGRVRDMVTYLTDVMRPDGLMPQCGDADDGRLHVLTGAGMISPQDPRHLLGPAALTFGSAVWLESGGDTAGWEAAWWGFDVPPFTPGMLPGAIRLCADAGHAVARRGNNYFLATNSIVGTKGFGNHKHNDQLSFEYHAHGHPVIVDPGSFVYTSDPAARNLFRSTRYHNTIEIDGVEQNELNPEWLFRMFESARAEHLSFTVEGDEVGYRGRHSGYTRLPSPVVHERQFSFNLQQASLAIRDRLTGAAAHRLVWHFHCAPSVEVQQAGTRNCLLRTAGGDVHLSWTGDLQCEVADAFYSPSYGVKVPCRAIALSCEADLTAEAEWSFAFQAAVSK